MLGQQQKKGAEQDVLDAGGGQRVREARDQRRLWAHNHQLHAIATAEVRHLHSEAIQVIQVKEGSR